MTLPAAASDVFLKLRTDYLWPSNFRCVRVELIDARDPTNSRVTLHAGGNGSDYVEGVEVAQFEDVTKKRDYYLLIQLLDTATAPVAGRAWSFKATKRQSRAMFEINRQ